MIARARTDDAGRWVVDLDLPLGDADVASTDSLFARLETVGWQGLTDDGPRLHGSLPAGAASKVTSLVAIELKRDPALDVKPETFVILAELRGAPADREQQLLLDLLPDAEKLMRLLFMLLVDGRDGTDAASEVRRMLANAMAGEPTGQGPQQLFENLVRTFSREPERLRTIKSVIDQVRARPDAQDRFPEGFLELRATFDAAFDRAQAMSFDAAPFLERLKPFSAGHSRARLRPSA